MAAGNDFKVLCEGSDASFSRLSAIAEAIGVSLTDLLSGDAEDTFTDVTFTNDQQDYFLRELRCFYFFWALVYERETVKEAERRLGLDSKTSTRYLRKLEDLDLIGVGPQNKLRLPRLTRIRWVGQGPLIERIYQDWGAQTVRDLARPSSKLPPSALFIIRYFKLRESSYEEFLRAQRDLEAEFVKRAIREMSLDLPKMKTVRWVTAIDDKSFLDGVRKI